MNTSRSGTGEYVLRVQSNRAQAVQMSKEEIQFLFAYNRWANARILEAVAPLTEEEFKRNLSSSHGSMHGTLTHILAAEWIWLMRCNGVSPKDLFDPEEFDNLASLKTKWVEVEQEQKRFMDELDQESLSRSIAYTNTNGEQWAYTLKQILHHVVNHSTYHRGQITTMLRQLGTAAVMTDLLVYIDTEPEAV